PVRKSSENSTRSAPAPRARRKASRASSRLCDSAPTCGLSCARAIRSRSVTEKPCCDFAARLSACSKKGEAPCGKRSRPASEAVAHLGEKAIAEQRPRVGCRNHVLGPGHGWRRATRIENILGEGLVRLALQVPGTAAKAQHHVVGRMEAHH